MVVAVIKMMIGGGGGGGRGYCCGDKDIWCCIDENTGASGTDYNMGNDFNNGNGLMNYDEDGCDDGDEYGVGNKCIYVNDSN
ncbi:hypothetical protein DPMN_018078 [Dreissena polymorpha]|uniref:Uncharacterized protein n=1 Tax=Dreissena polymorpha TaxID=45954 RepID=A0A9D4S6Z3_DREPO|nr:hypothetical protein DPMN_018078 [Dreissena polymorpha]